MRIGIFGGSFDPVHYGHLILAELCREECDLDEVRLVPAAVPPHKQDRGRASGEHRIEMLKLAIGGNPHLSVWDGEINRGGVSYTVETLRQIKAEQSDDELFFLMGADSLFDLPNWREPTEICELATIVVVNRPGAKAVDYSVLESVTSTDRIEHFSSHLVTMPQLDISSTELRERIKNEQSIRYQTSRSVEQYIRTADLYQ